MIVWVGEPKADGWTYGGPLPSELKKKRNEYAHAARSFLKNTEDFNPIDWNTLQVEKDK